MHKKRVPTALVILLALIGSLVLPLSVAEAASLALSLRLPAVNKVALNVPTPLVTKAPTGNSAAESLAENEIVPE